MNSPFTHITNRRSTVTRSTIRTAAFALMGALSLNAFFAAAFALEVVSTARLLS